MSLCPRSLPVFLVWVFLSPLTAVSAQGLDQERSRRLFTESIETLFQSHCYECHSHQSDIRGGLALDSVLGLQKGGHSGPAIVPGDPEASLLWRAVSGAMEDLQMPKSGPPLEPQALKRIREWIESGAVDPRVQEPAKGASFESHWAFQRPTAPPIPAVGDPSWVRNPIDAFVLSKLEAAGMEPAPEASPQTLVRRLAFDLTGLPPTYEEANGFTRAFDADPQAYGRWMRQMMDSPHFGERWGRHWLDVARYADTKGYVFTEERRFPFSFTYRDYVIRSFNQDKPYDQFIVEQIAADRLELGEDKRALAGLGFLTLGRRFLNNPHDIIDDRIDVVTRGLMGLTVSCARCHDHKYDPITAEDYYALYGVFASSREPDELPVLTGAEVDPAQRAAFEKELEERERKFETTRVRHHAAALREARERSVDYWEAARDAEGMDGSARDSLARERKLSPEILNRWVDRLRQDDDRGVLAVWKRLASLPTDEDVRWDALAAVSSDSLNRHLATASERQEDPVSGLRAYVAAWAELDAEETPDDLRELWYGSGAVLDLNGGQIQRLLAVKPAQELRRLKADVDRLPATHPGAPPRAMALVDRERPVDPYVFLRGQAGRRGRDVPRRFLTFLSDGEPTPFREGSGRLEMARNIASRENPLTARVWVNRVWSHYFGAPLVASPSDFGLRSEKPLQQDLLDYLSVYFMDHGWSLKQLSAHILDSATYRQSSIREGSYAATDPENRYLWKMNRKRLEFEPMRDQVLAVSGALDLSQGGRSVEITKEPFTPRRSVYGFVERQNLPSLLRTFDFASPDTTAPKRFETTAPQQALFFMNSPWILNQARGLAARTAERTGVARIRQLFQLALSRDPTSDELARAVQYVEGDSEATWEALSQTLLMVNEALFVD